MWHVTYDNQAQTSTFMKDMVMAPFRTAPSKATKKVIAQTATSISKMYSETLPAFAWYEVVCPLALLLLVESVEAICLIISLLIWL
jgi:hypothetical protein